MTNAVAVQSGSLYIAPKPTEGGMLRALEFEDAIRQLPPVVCEVESFYIDGVYIRKIMIPAGTAISSEVHREECFSIVSKGRIAVDHDEGPRLFVAGDHVYSPPGIKRRALAHEDTIWTTIHKNFDNERDLAKLKARYTLPAVVPLEDRSYVMGNGCGRGD